MTRPQTFVILHAAWQDPSFWDDVTNRLVSNGHTVYCPRLPGHGQCANTSIGPRHCANAVKKLITHLDLSNVVLLGHSLGGVFATMVAARIPDRIGHLIMLSSFVPEDGKSVFDDLPPQYRHLFSDIASKSRWPEVLLPYEIWRDHFVNDGDPELAAISYRRLHPVPLKLFTEPIQLDPTTDPAIPKTYIHCTDDKALPAGEWELLPRMPARLGACRVITMPGGHVTPLTQPKLLADVIDRTIAEDERLQDLRPASATRQNPAG